MRLVQWLITLSVHPGQYRTSLLISAGLVVWFLLLVHRGRRGPRWE